MLCVLLTIAILGGVWMLSARVTSAQIYAALEELPVTNKTSEISAYLDRYFIDDYDEQALADAAASAMVTATGDRWSYYLSAADYQTYEESMNNAYVGIGVRLRKIRKQAGFASSRSKQTARVSRRYRGRRYHAGSRRTEDHRNRNLRYARSGPRRGRNDGPPQNAARRRNI